MILGFPRAAHKSTLTRLPHPSPLPLCIGSMRPPQKKKATKLRSWRVSVLRARGEYLGDVQAPDQKAAEAAAVTQFDLSEEQRKRLVVRERE